MKHRNSSVPISVTIEGQEYLGSYAIEGRLITVRYNGIQNTTQLGGSAAFPESLARIMLGELVRGKAA